MFKKWLHSGWRSCGDLDAEGINGVPRWLRCMRCGELVTHAQVQQGGCVCGMTRLVGAYQLSMWEMIKLKAGRYRLNARESASVKPILQFKGGRHETVA